jgi:DtxR family transcriptional regulator, Mn-dependent transcriptional regulator
MNTLVEENYLKAVFSLSNEKGEVNVSELSEKLDIKMPTVTSMMKKLAAKGLVHYESYKPVRLTVSGQKEAALIIRKHRLTEMFLVDKMGFGWDAVHEIAEQVEHIQSPEFFEKMDELLGYPKFDPHGSPIPDKEGNMEWKSYEKLIDLLPGNKAKVAAVVNASDDFLKFLNSRSIFLGLELEVLSVESFDHSMVVRYGDRNSETFSQTVSERLLVDRLL